MGMDMVRHRVCRSKCWAALLGVAVAMAAAVEVIMAVPIHIQAAVVAAAV